MSDAKFSESGLVSAIGLVMAVVITMMCLAVLFGFFFHFYRKWCLHRRPEGGDANAAPTSRWRRRFDFAGGHQETMVATIHCHGLDPSVLKTMPIVLFSEKDFEDGVECSVCLSDVCEGEKARFLPNCSHGFHMECIDMWFQSHATCPLCRNPVSVQCDKKNSNQESSTTMEGELRIQVEDNARMFPTNVLLYGNGTEISIFGPMTDVNQCVSSQFPSASVTTSASSLAASSGSLDANSPDGTLAIDIPLQANEEEEKSPITPRGRSFMRLLSRDGGRANQHINHDLDVEQER